MEENLWIRNYTLTFSALVAESRSFMAFFTTAVRHGDCAAVITCLNDDDTVYRVFGVARLGGEDNSYRFSCTKGKVENLRGTGGMVNVHYNHWQTPEG